jgi:hypothetical protein
MHPRYDAKQQAEYKVANAEKVAKDNAEYRANHKAENAKRSAQWYKENSEKVILATYLRRLAAAGWTQEMYDAKFEEQHGQCALCNREQVDKKLSADHEHIEPPNPRGLLCTSCNRALGYFKDSPELLRKAAEYIEKYKTQTEGLT